MYNSIIITTGVDEATRSSRETRAGPQRDAARTRRVSITRHFSATANCANYATTQCNKSEFNTTAIGRLVSVSI